MHSEYHLAEPSFVCLPTKETKYLEEVFVQVNIDIGKERKREKTKEKCVIKNQRAHYLTSIKL